MSQSHHIGSDTLEHAAATLPAYIGADWHQPTALWGRLSSVLDDSSALHRLCKQDRHHSVDTQKVPVAVTVNSTVHQQFKATRAAVNDG